MDEVVKILTLVDDLVEQSFWHLKDQGKHNEISKALNAMAARIAELEGTR